MLLSGRLTACGGLALGDPNMVPSSALTSFASGNARNPRPHTAAGGGEWDLILSRRCHVLSGFTPSYGSYGGALFLQFLILGASIKLSRLEGCEQTAYLL